MTKTNTIEAIRTLNPTASTEFLDGFTPDELSAYLDRLNRLHTMKPASTSSSDRHSPLPAGSDGNYETLPFSMDDCG